ncbi:MAG: hemerythrin domain-containing protein [Bacteroidota bacterium]
MKPTEILMHEHTIVLKMLEGAERVAQTIETTHEVNVEKIGKIIDFSRNFTDGCHHAKEEKHFFPRLQERGMSKEQGPIAVMLHEHRIGRELIRSLEQALYDHKLGKIDAAGRITQFIRQYIELLRAHIAKENNVLFPMSGRYLTTEDQSSLERAFNELEERETGKGEHERFHRIANEL